MEKSTPQRFWNNLGLKELRETIVARGHQNVLATHPTTLEFTRETALSKKGNCIIAVCANKTMKDLSPALKQGLQRERSEVCVLIETGEITETVHALGSLRLTLSHPTDFVVRKGDYMCNRTLAVHADKSACDLSRTLVQKLKNPRQEVTITLIVKV